MNRAIRLSDYLYIKYSNHWDVRGKRPNSDTCCHRFTLLFHTYPDLTAITFSIVYTAQGFTCSGARPTQLPSCELLIVFRVPSTLSHSTDSVWSAFSELMMMSARNLIQISYGLPGILCYYLVFYAMFGVRRTLSRSFVVIYTMMAVSVSLIFNFYYLFC